RVTDLMRQLGSQTSRTAVLSDIDDILEWPDSSIYPMGGWTRSRRRGGNDERNVEGKGSISLPELRFVARREESSNEVPVPGVAPHTGARVLERFVLEVFRRESCPTTVGQEFLAIGGHQVGHAAPLPDMAVQPEAAVHRVQHSVAPLLELAVWGGPARTRCHHAPPITRRLLAGE